MKLSPIHIEVLLHYLADPEEHPRHDSPAVMCAINWFLGEGIFELTKPSHSVAMIDYNSSYRVTERGRVFVDMLCETPFPVPTWKDPRK